MIVAFRDEGERQFMLQELRHLSVGRTPPEVRLLSGEQMRNLEPAIGPTLTHGLSLAAQRFVEPRAFTEALGAAVVGEGASLVIDTVVAVDDGRSGVRVICAEGGEQRYDTVMLACGTGVARLGRRFGVRAPMRAGRGYSFDIALEQSPRGPIYLPGARVACTPFDGRLRVVGVMDLDRPDDPLDPRRLDALVRTASRLLEGVDLDSRRSDWVGARPCTADGLPLIGFTESSRSTPPEATACGA
jgi:D-amino-acid dehydrogenase